PGVATPVGGREGVGGARPEPGRGACPRPRRAEGVGESRVPVRPGAPGRADEVRRSLVRVRRGATPGGRPRGLPPNLPGHARRRSRGTPIALLPRGPCLHAGP